ncbi:peptide-methionine (S)-S-oxide reductase [Cribrihabitans marinus]|uniref:Peptide methionine sulfoxide reductase MsrA n=1 Tax=Cribrihabitans marinus TaxID=1227549 RepID=A0A1H6YDU5_9RHOB|nr:peptide-methionine (S)-S-oxide reductase MsrA [Cribrihabitans marinus]GGH29046.1 peptide methionine sulfoxide reductase MsrA [Cribrihabitans marinus]SEJ39431.1 peptide-methionine (S)-S-oxide reductase [Cribrihabitans marinus]
MISRETLKLTILAAGISLAAVLQPGRAHAAGPETLTVAGGCFWCVEADFERVAGVREVVSGYIGGTVKNPTYKQVTGGGTGHYEAVQIRFDPDRVSRRALLAMFLRSVDPTDPGGQFCDRGNSYRTAIFVSDKGESAMAEEVIAAAQAELGQKIVTPVLPEGPFYEAEDYHQDYYKGDKLVLTRFGPKRQSSAYKAYRKACDRDERVRELWGNDAPFAGG